MIEKKHYKVKRSEEKKETIILGKTDHRNIVKLIECDDDEHHFKLMFEDLKGGELFKRNRKSNR